jgi:hypothetical protein
VSERLFDGYSEAVGASLSDELQRKRRDNEQRRQEYEARLESLERMHAALELLGVESERVAAELGGLDERYGETESELLIQPAPPPKPAATQAEPLPAEELSLRSDETSPGSGSET